MSELYWYINEYPDNDDVPSVRHTLSFLESCNKMFESGFLSHSIISDMNSDPLKSINEGFKFIIDWISDIIKNDKKFHNLKLN
jgi:hypothetical protein